VTKRRRTSVELAALRGQARELRQASGLTAKDIGSRLGVGPDQISRWCRGVTVDTEDLTAGSLGR